MDAELHNTGLYEFLLWVVRRRRRFRITGNSMQPLLLSGNEVLVNPKAYKKSRPQSGDIVVARHPHRANLQIVKRIAGSTKDGRYLLKGDNLLESTDSRAFGPVAAEHILGKVTCRFG